MAKIKAPPTVEEVLKAAPTAAEVLGRPGVYAEWYNGMRKEALGEPYTKWRD